MSDLFSKELEDRYNELKQNIQLQVKSFIQNQKVALQTAMDLLSAAKVLVNIHDADDSYLIEAHQILGKTYLNYDCFQQSIEHLTVKILFQAALQKNDRKFDSPDSKKMHIQLLVLLSDAYFKDQQFDTAQNLLEQVMTLQQTLNMQVSAYSQRVQAKMYVQQKKNHQAEELFNKILTFENDENIQIAFTYIDLGVLLQNQQRYDEAFENVDKGIKILKSLEYYDEINFMKIFKIQKKIIQKSNQPVEKKLEINQQILDLKKKLTNDVDRKTLKLYQQLADYHLILNQKDEALSAFSNLVACEQQLYDQDDERIQLTFFKMAQIKEDQDKLDEAQLSYAQIRDIAEKNQFPELLLSCKQKLKFLQTKE